MKVDFIEVVGGKGVWYKITINSIVYFASANKDEALDFYNRLGDGGGHEKLLFSKILK